MSQAFWWVEVTTEQIEDQRIEETLGLVRGSTIRARHMGYDLTADLRNVAGGEVKDYTVMLAQAREEAVQTMIEQAEKMSANAIVGARFVTSMVMLGTATMAAYGTAVRLV
ncbi:MAG: YbjQ family protein [Dehalococcoidia bacterium]